MLLDPVILDIEFISAILFDTSSILDPSTITYSSSSNDETCGSSDGSLSMLANGGSGSFQFSIDGGVTLQSSGTFTGLSAGIYSIIIEDANGCQVSGIETIGSTGGATITNTTSTDLYCFGDII